jgi:hypothetical protein
LHPVHGAIGTGEQSTRVGEERPRLRV